MRAAIAAAAAALLFAGPAAPAAAQTPRPQGQLTFELHCAKCHGADGTGGDQGPALADRLEGLNDTDIADLVRGGLPDQGMPSNDVADADMAALITFLRTIKPPAAVPVTPRVFTRTDGRTIEGVPIAEGLNDLQVRTSDAHVHLLRRSGSRVREVTSQRDWPSYNGDPGGNRYTPLAAINAATIGRLAPRWVFSVPGARNLQTTPIVAGGLMYVTATNECFALDAGSGRLVWHYQRPRTPELRGGSKNRGAAVAGDRLFMVTDNAHVIALNRFTGALLWDTEMADWHQNYFSTVAPLPAGNLVISGVSGGESGANGFVVAHDQATGREVWRFRTVPRPGEPGSETWEGSDLEHGGAPTWFTGSYDPTLDLVYWPVGNPSQEYNGDDRRGDNLYANCILALDRRTGQLRWYYQFTPHDLWDWDATQTSVLVDAPWHGRVRHLMLHADRNGFFYVFDRATGERLLSTPFVQKLTWASGIGADGRPILQPNQAPSSGGTLVCPSQDGATNWFSPSFNPATGLYYVQAFEKCSIYQKRTGDVWRPGQDYLGGTQQTAFDPTPVRVLKAIDIQTGAIRWTLPQSGPANSWGGTLTTGSGLVFFGSDDGSLAAANARTGRLVWSFPTNHSWRASPMAYEFDRTEFIAVAADSQILAFALPPEPAAAK